MKQAIDRLVEYGYIQGKDLSICFEEMLDFFIESFDVKRVMRHKCDYAALFKEREKENPVFFELMRQWLTLSAQGIEKDGAFDFFGIMYEEMVKGKFKSSSYGQFFTPLPLCKTMAELVYSDAGRTINDCACGSGRTLLAHFAISDKSKFFYYYAEDLDPVCVKMCALNFIVHGMIGQVVNHNALEQNFHGAYEVNEIKWPIPNPCCCIRKLTEHEYWARRYELVHRGSHVESALTEHASTEPVAVDHHPQPQQLHLFNF